MRPQNYFTKILEDNIKATIKPQYVDHIPKAVRGLVGKILQDKDERSAAEDFDCYAWIHKKLELSHVLDRDVAVLSGGELQRFAIAAVVVQSSDMYVQRSEWKRDKRQKREPRATHSLARRSFAQNEQKAARNSLPAAQNELQATHSGATRSQTAHSGKPRSQ